MRALLKQGEPVNVTVGGSPDSLRVVFSRWVRLCVIVKRY
jgi:hypothetical protein